MARIGNENGGWDFPNEGDHIDSPVLLKGYIEDPHEKGRGLVFSFMRKGVEQHQEKYSVPPNATKFETNVATPLLGPLDIQAYVITSNEGKYLPDINNLYRRTPAQEIA